MLFALVIPAVSAAGQPEVAVTCSSGAHWVAKASDGASGCGRGSDGAIRVGHWIWHGDDGHALYEINYDEEGREDGLATSYGLTGRVVLTQQFVHGQLEGPETQWWPESGHLREQKNYRRGKIHGIRNRWVFEPHLRKDCTSDKERCWVGTQECWIDGERQLRGVCSGMAANPAVKRNPASGH